MLNPISRRVKVGHVIPFFPPLEFQPYHMWGLVTLGWQLDFLYLSDVSKYVHFHRFTLCKSYSSRSVSRVSARLQTIGSLCGPSGFQELRLVWVCWTLSSAARQTKVFSFFGARNKASKTLSCATMPSGGLLLWGFSLIFLTLSVLTTVFVVQCRPGHFAAFPTLISYLFRILSCVVPFGAGGDEGQIRNTVDRW